MAWQGTKGYKREWKVQSWAQGMQKKVSSIVLVGSTYIIATKRILCFSFMPFYPKGEKKNKKKKKNKARRGGGAGDGDEGFGAFRV